MPRLSPSDLYNNYRKGFSGCLWEPHVYDQLLENSKYGYFKDGSRKIKNSGKGKLSTPYKSVLKFDKNPYNERQVTGDCHEAGTRVLMSDGSLKNIEDIKIGEYVVTHTGKNQKVYELINKIPQEKQINRIYIKNYDKELALTNGHQMLVYTEYGYEWVEARNLKENDMLVLPKSQIADMADRQLDLTDYLDNLNFVADSSIVRVKNSKNTMPRFVDLSADLMWLFGLYAAEGGVDGNNRERITFNLNIKETELRDRIIYLLNKIFGAKCTIFERPKQNVVCVRCSNIIVARIFCHFINGNQWTKTLNREILNSSKYHRLAFIRGWCDGDGSITTHRRRRVVGVSVSNNLIHNISDILISLQIQHTITKRKPRNRSKKASQINLYGEQVYKVYPELSCMTKIATKQNRLTCSLGLLAPITSITNEQYDQNVYCINVEHDHSFIANGLISHNCVSHGTRNACDVSRAVEIDVHRDREAWLARGATEAIYGARGHGGQGMSCARAATFVSENGGILVRKNYEGVADFSKYNGNMGARWGSRGLPDNVIDVANDHQIKTVSLVRTVEEARDALANGYGLAVCSSYGFSNKRDKNGFAKVSGSWAHCMAWIACDDTGSEPAFLVQNSWGKWNDGGHPEWGKIPDGSFLIHADAAAGMLKQNGSYAFSQFDGFPVQKLPSYGFEDYL